MSYRLDRPIETERLILRPFEPDDLDALGAILIREDVHRYLYTSPMDLDGIAAALERRIGNVTLEDEGDALTPAVVRKDTGELIGDVMLLWRSKSHEQGEIGYTIHPAQTGHGFATEAAREMLRLGFDTLGLHRLIGRLDGRNTASARLLERLGMRREAHFVENEIVKGEWTDELVYAMLRDEWQARGGAAQSS